MGTQPRVGRALRRPVRERQRPARIPSRGGLSEGQIVEIQRSRLLAGAVDAIEEFGYAQTTVAQITSRARVSRRTFYELFENREACLSELVENVLTMIEDDLAHAGLEGLPWRERVRGGLWVILSFFDREPPLARVCVVHSQQGGPAVLARREEILGRLGGVLELRVLRWLGHRARRVARPRIQSRTPRRPLHHCRVRPPQGHAGKGIRKCLRRVGCGL
ncbi:MAG TPA: TetR/AcrR family transcriptional regulator [Solirubrobacteraceae bacterium]|nr:TetR/AcrR family transcriptional regulator [Solirubrobacteraceae bacterium]